MSDQDTQPTFKSLLFSALSFTFSNKKQLAIIILTFLLPFLIFFPILFIGLSVQSTFLLEYQSLHPLESDAIPSVTYFPGYDQRMNSSLIPLNLLSSIDRDLEDIIFLSHLEEFIAGYLTNFHIQLMFYLDENFYHINGLFIQNESLVQLSNNFELPTIIPQLVNEIVLVKKTDYHEEILLESHSIGDNVSISPFTYEETEILFNNTFIIDPLNATVINIFNINDFFEKRLEFENPFTYAFMKNSLMAPSNNAFFIHSITFLPEFLQQLTKLLGSEASLNVQFLYDFSTFKITNLNKIHQHARDMDKLSGFSYYHDFEAHVTTELEDFLDSFRIDISLQWLRMFSIALPVLIFSLIILWISFSSNLNQLSDIYANFMTRGFSRKTIFRIFTISRFIEIGIACLAAFILAFPISYVVISIISSFLKSGFLKLNLISVGFVLIPSLLFFLFIFIFALVNLLILNRRVEKHFPDRLSSFKVATTGSTTIQNLVIGLSSLFSLTMMSFLFILDYYIKSDYSTSSEVSFILIIFEYIFISISVFCILMLIINIIVKQLIKTSRSIWKKISKRFSIIFHNLSLTFQHHKRQSLFIAITFCVFLQSLLIPLYLSQHAADSAKFSLGSDLSVQLENTSYTASFLTTTSTIPSISSASNYSLVQLSIFDTDYQVLVLPDSFATAIFFTDRLDYGFEQNTFTGFLNSNNSIFIQSDDRFLKNHIISSNNSINLLFDNNSASDDEAISKNFVVYGQFHIFPILFNDFDYQKYQSFSYYYLEPIPFLIMSESSFKSILPYRNDLSLTITDQAIILKLTKQSNLNAVLQELELLSYQLSYQTWLDVYPKFLPTFSASIFALATISWFLIGLSFLVISFVLVQDMLKTRQEKILVFRYRGYSRNNISRIFLVEHLIILFIAVPLGCGVGIASFIYLLYILKPEQWILNLTHYSKYSLILVGVLLVLTALDILIRYFYQRRFLDFHPTIMEGV